VGHAASLVRAKRSRLLCLKVGDAVAGLEAECQGSLASTLIGSGGETLAYNPF